MILLCKAMGGYVGCGLFNMATADLLNEVAAVVRGVSTPEEILASKVIEVTKAAASIGVQVGMSGAEAIELMRQPPAKL